MELLVVVAIIAILAGIVLPKVGPYIAKARMAKATAEIRSIETSLQKMLTDTNRDNFAGNRFFNNWTDVAGALTTEEQTALYTQAFYILLKNGRLGADQLNAETGLSLHDDVRAKMGTSYMDVTADPWGQLYQFYAGPWADANPVPFRIYKPDLNVPGGPAADPATEQEMDEEGVLTGELVGFPAPKDLFIYIWSKGQNLESNQAFDAIGQTPDYQGGGDDINSWDKDSSYSVFYS